MTKEWNPDLYRRFEAERTRPAAELLARIPPKAFARVVDLGCGPGNSTALLHQAYPNAALTGVDTSASMLEQAAVRVPSAQFIQADFTDWQSDAPPDLLFANAALQWAGNHADLLPRLVGQLAEGGVLAVQMPDNLEQPSHLLMAETARLPQWQPQMQAMKNRRPLAEAEEYYDILTAASCSVDIWRTTYYHIMPDAEAIVHWFRATGLRPFLNRLTEAEQAAFCADYLEKLRAAYPQQADGNVLLAFPRLFFVAEKSKQRHVLPNNA